MFRLAGQLLVIDAIAQFAPIAASSSGATPVVSAIPGKTIRVIGLWLMANGTVNVNLQSDVTTARATGLMYLIANTGWSTGLYDSGFFDTVVGEGLDINLSASQPVGGQLVYIPI